MNRFIKVTTYGNDRWINVDHIVSIEINCGTYSIFTADGNWATVKVTDESKKIINEILGISE